MTDPKTYPGTLYSYTAGTYCGVLITENVLRKITALHHEHLEKVKRVLADNASEVFPSMWTLHYPEGKQTQVDYIDTSRSVEETIRSAAWLNQPRACFPVFIAAKMAEAEAMADTRHLQMHPDGRIGRDTPAVDWPRATPAEIGEALDASLERQRAAFPEPTAAAYAAEQRAPDPEDDCQDYG